MNWAKIADLIIAVGLPAAYSVWQKYAAAKEPTQADWDELHKLANQHGKDRMLEVLKLQGIDPASDQGKALIALVS